MVKKSLNRATIVGTIMETNFTYDPKAENLFDKSISVFVFIWVQYGIRMKWRKISI